MAAHLSRGLSVQRLGRELKDFVRLPWPQATKQRGEARGGVIYIDHFGNAITNIEAPLISRKGAGMCELKGRRKVCCPLMEFYGAVPVNRPVAVQGSSGCLEIALNGGSSARKFGLRGGDKVIVTLKS